MESRLSFGLIIAWTLAAAWLGAAIANVAAAPQRQALPFPAPGAKPKILFTGMPGFPILDSHYQRKLAACGYPTATATYPEIPPLLRNIGTGRNLNPRGADVVVVTMASDYNLPFAGANGRAALRFVRKGGGLLLMVGNTGYAGVRKLLHNVNNFLAPLGARILWQRVHDGRHRAKFSWIISYTFYSTDNITRGNPITRGIHHLWYPGGNNRGVPTTYTMRPSPAWKVLVRGDTTASSPGYPSAPPLAAVRSYGKGRIAVITWFPQYSINNGYPFYGGYMLGNKGDGFRFLENLYDWLGQPSMRGGRIYPRPRLLPKRAAGEAAVAPPPPPPFPRAALAAQLNASGAAPVYRGIIGVRPSPGAGHATVAAFCRAARQLGLNFLVFTPDYARMSVAKWRRLKRQCRAGSTANFVAMPGLRVNGSSQPGERIVFNFDSWPAPADVAPNAWPSLLFHHRQWPTMVLVHPDLNKQSPWQMKFYTALALVTYNAHNRVQSHVFREYRKLVASDYRLVPCVVNNISSVPALKAAARGWLTYTRAPSVAGIPASLRTEYGSGHSFVSNGPVIGDFKMAGYFKTTGYPPNVPYHGIAGSGMMFKIGVSSRYPLTRVTLWRNDTIFRRFFPDRREFSGLVQAINDKNGVFTLTARNTQGQRVISNQLRVYNRLFGYTMCVDKQNSFITLPYVVGNIAGFISGFDTGAAWILKPPSQVAPAGEDMTWAAVSDLQTAPEFYLAGGFQAPACLWRRGDFNSDDALVSGNRYGGGLAAATVKYTMFRPPVGGYNIIMVKSTVKLKKTLQLENHGQGPNVVLFKAMSNTAINLYRRWSLCEPNGTTRQGRVNLRRGQDGRMRTVDAGLSQGGYAAFWPSHAGNFAVFPLGGRKYRVALGLSTNRLESFINGRNKYRNCLELGYRMPQKSLPAGTVLRAQFLFVLDNGQGAPADFQFIRKACGLAGPPAYRVSLRHGRVLSTTYTLTLQASNGYVRGDVSKAKLPNGHLGVIVKGLNDNWDAGIYDTKTRTLRRVGTYHGAAYVLLNTSGTNEFVIGNLVEADKPFVKLTVVKFGRHRLAVIAQNPTDRPATFRVSSLFSATARKCRLAAGGTATIGLRRR